jgi:hypothetical protein
MSVGTFWDTTNHHLISGQRFLNTFWSSLWSRLDTKLTKSTDLPPPNGWPNRGRQQDDHAYLAHVQFQASTHMG